MFNKAASATVGFLLLTTPLTASADTLSSLQAQVQALLAQISALKTQPVQSNTTSTTPVSPSTSPAVTSSASSLAFSVAPYSGQAPLATTFTYTLNSSNSCSSQNYILNFGDGSSQTLYKPYGTCYGYVQHTTHNYTAAAIYTASLGLSQYSCTGSIDKATGKPSYKCSYDVSKKNAATVTITVASLTPQPLAQFNVTAPVAGQSFSVGNVLHMQWIDSVGVSSAGYYMLVYQAITPLGQGTGIAGSQLGLTAVTGTSYDWVISPSLTTGQYFIRVCKDSGTCADSGTFTVNGVTPVTPAPSIIFTANPSVITQGQSTQLGWITSNATRCTLMSATGQQNVATAGTQTVAPVNTGTVYQLITTYSLWCINESNGTTNAPSTTAQATVTVNAPTPTPTPTIVVSASPSIVVNGVGTTQLKWDVSNVPSGAALEIGVSGAALNAGGDATLPYRNILSTYPLDGTTGVVDLTNGHSMTSVPSHGTINFSPSYYTGYLPISGPVNFTVLDASANILAHASAALTITAPAQTPGSLNVTMTPISADTVMAGARRTFVMEQLDATQSTEDVRVGGLPILLTTNTTNAYTDLSGCTVVANGTTLTTGSHVINTIAWPGTMQFTFDNPLTVVKGTVVTLSVVCSVSSAAATGDVLTFSTIQEHNGEYAAVGATSGTHIVPTTYAGQSGPYTIAQNGTLSITTDASSPSYSLVAGGSQGVTIGAFKFHASNEPINLSKVGLSIASGGAQDLGTVYLYSGNALIGTAIFTGANKNATSTLNTPYPIPQNSDVVITVKADIGSIGVGQPATAGDLVQVVVANAQGSGASSGATINTSASTSVPGVRIVKSFPIVSQLSLPTSGLFAGSNASLFRFSISASPSGSVGILGVNQVRLAIGGVTLSNPRVSVYSDPSFSIPVPVAPNAYQNVSASSGYLFATLNNGGIIEIPAGATYYFQVSGDLSNLTTGASIIASLPGDTTPVGLYSYSNNPSNITYNFIWTPNDLTTSQLSTVDWTNGYAVPGLSSSGVNQTRTAASSDAYANLAAVSIGVSQVSSAFAIFLGLLAL